ncbi:tetratricopeptide repeat protein [Nonlabens antarcticus]|uniref:tetratricopeptide repeat protein n=1 Tax=Nonlabens antarcticus TaxID=392714 RepID=UPI001891D674|nr:tetratricopeptide repeat protein [Nonlabens antarcticus]
MAAYNKRGYKPKTSKEKEAVEETDSATAEVFTTLDEGAGKTEAWVEKNQKIILYVVIAIAVIAALSWVYTEFVHAPKADEALEESTQANFFYDQAINATGEEQDSLFNLALDGGEGKYGLLKIADEYSGTDAGNIANYQIGMAYLNLGGVNYQKAIDFLTSYDGDGSIMEAYANAGIGDALVQVGQEKDAVSYYNKAADIVPNEFTTPKYLLKAAQASLNTGDNSTAIKNLERIEEEFPEAQEAQTAQVLLGQAQAASN